MKKFLIAVILIAIVGSVHAQTVVIQQHGIFTDLATALIEIPCAAVEGIVTGTVGAVGGLFTGTTTVVTPGTTVVAPPAPVVVAPRQTVVTSPIVIGVPRTTVTTTVSSPVKVPGATVIPDPVTTIVTDYGNGTAVTVTRPASGYELGGGIVYPVAPYDRVGTSPFVNPYIRRPRH